MAISAAMKRQQAKMKKAAAAWRGKSASYKASHTYTSFVSKYLGGSGRVKKKKTAKRRTPARRTRATTTRKRRKSVTMARRKTTRRRASRGFKLGKPLIRGGILAAFAGVGASMLSQQFMPNNVLVKYGAALGAGGTSGVIGVLGSDVLAGRNPLTLLGGITATKPTSVYGGM